MEIAQLALKLNAEPMAFTFLNDPIPINVLGVMTEQDGRISVRLQGIATDRAAWLRLIARLFTDGGSDMAVSPVALGARAVD